MLYCYSQEIHSLKAQLEAAKYDVIKYCIGTIVSISAVGLAVLHRDVKQANTFFCLPKFIGGNPLEEDRF